MATAEWHLMKSSDGQVFGPVSREDILTWASEAKISPLDKISTDGQQNWLRAPMVEELQMDWLIEMPDKYLYGPTNIGTIQEFLAVGEIGGDDVVINCLDGSERRICEMPFFQVSPHQARGVGTTFQGTQYSKVGAGAEAVGTAHRVHLLEKQAVEYQRVIDEWQQAYRSLRQQFIEATGREPL